MILLLKIVWCVGRAVPINYSVHFESNDLICYVLILFSSLLLESIFNSVASSRNAANALISLL